MALWQGKKTMRVTKFHEENFFLRVDGVVIIGEYNVPCCWPFSGTDAHPLHAINHTNISAHSCNPSEQLLKSIKFSY